MQVRGRVDGEKIMSTRKVLGKNVEELKNKKVVIVGVGGIGCTVANLLARLGIGLTIIDHDIVDDTNLERQILFDKNDLLKYKIDAAKEKLSQFTEIKTIREELTKNNITIIPENVDLVIDCTDNVETRLLINDYCRKNKINWIYSGAVSNIGTVFFVGAEKNACYQCLNLEKNGETSCEIGVLNSIVTMIASLIVNVAVNYLVNEKIEDKLIRINFNDSTLIKIRVNKNPECKSCRGEYKYLA
jgi:adenylyltransferase/sulfurtransferase